MTSLVFPVATSVFSRVCVVPRDCQATLALAHPTHSSVTWDGKHSLTHPHFHSENLVPSHKAPSGSLSVPLLIPTSTQFLVAPMLLGNKRPLHSTSGTETQKSPNSPQCDSVRASRSLLRGTSHGHFYSTLLSGETRACHLPRVCQVRSLFSQQCERMQDLRLQTRSSAHIFSGTLHPRWLSQSWGSFLDWNQQLPEALL